MTSPNPLTASPASPAAPDAAGGDTLFPPRADRLPLRDRFALLARQSEAALMRNALRLCRGGQDCAQELVQDALVRAYDAFRKGQFDSAKSTTPASVAAWFVRIMTNNFINSYRRTKKWDAGVTVDTLTSGGNAGPSQTRAEARDIPGESLLLATFDEPIEYALAKLSDSLRMAVLLVDVQGHSYEEAAQILNVPVGTVRSRLSRARFQLHELLQDYAKQKRIIQ